MHWVLQILFVAILGIAIFLFYKKAKSIKRNIFLGKAQDIYDNSSARWKNVLLLAFGQKKMFQNPLVALLHLVVYVGFIIINIEVVEILFDGVFGTHRILLKVLPTGLYKFLINSFEVLALLVLVACVIFLVRRNITKVARLNSPDLQGFPKSDANYILCTEIILMSLFLIMNAADVLLQQQNAAHYNQATTGSFIVSQHLQPLLQSLSTTSLQGIERGAWWLHIIGILAFLNYLPYSKHLHIILAFPNAYYAKLNALGEIKNMPDIQNEVLYAMQPELAPADAVAPESFGAKDVFDLSWKNLLDAYSCTECGRCTAACPANITGKKLSPRNIMMKTRDRLEAVGKNIDTNGSFVADENTLLHNYISVEELRACTTCNACVAACPVSISPLDIIIELRRNLIMEESNSTPEWNNMFSNIENNFAPWKLSPDDRDAWVANA